MHSLAQSTVLGRIAVACSSVALVASAVLLPLSQRLPERTGIPVFFLWLGLTLVGGALGIVLGAMRRSSGSLQSRAAVIAGCIASALLLLILVHPIVLVWLQGA